MENEKNYFNKKHLQRCRICDMSSSEMKLQLKQLLLIIKNKNIQQYKSPKRKQQLPIYTRLFNTVFRDRIDWKNSCTFKCTHQYLLDIALSVQNIEKETFQKKCKITLDQIIEKRYHLSILKEHPKQIRNRIIQEAINDQDRIIAINKNTCKKLQKIKKSTKLIQKFK